MLCVEPTGFGDLLRAQKLLFESSKNTSNVVFELNCKGQHKSLTNGGTWADDQTVEEGWIAHMRAGNENRWIVQEHIINLTAPWICSSSWATFDESELLQI